MVTSTFGPKGQREEYEIQGEKEEGINENINSQIIHKNTKVTKIDHSEIWFFM